VEVSRGEGLNSEGLEALLAALDPDRERAGQEYERIRSRLIRLFEWRGCDVPEELTDETINRVARRIAEGVKLQSAPYGFFCGVANLVHKEFLRERARKRTILESEDWTTTSGESDELSSDRRLECLRHCLSQLPEDQRRLVLVYHQEDNHIQSRKALSQELQIPMNALRIRVHRLRRRLEECVEECLRK
jgi:DNA-directed RNA polymerase specialized sigma24 family protein